MPKIKPSLVEPKHLLWFVYGAVSEWNLASNANLSAEDLAAYQRSTLNKVDQYLFNNAIIDGSYSDLQAGLSLEAEKLFASKEVRLASAVEATKASPDYDGSVYLDGPGTVGEFLGLQLALANEYRNVDYPIRELNGKRVVEFPFGTYYLS